MSSIDKTDIADRMKNQYEFRTRYLLPRRTYSIIRLDQKCGHSYTKKLNKPFDKGYIEDFDSAISSIMSGIQGARFAYVQSDECSILLTDFEIETTCAWFDGNIQKIASVSASLLTAEFNRFRLIRDCGIESADKYKKSILAHFDSRVFTIPDRTEVMNYFIWRQMDCIRNSISGLAQSLFSHNKLNNKNTSEMQEMMMSEKNVNWARDLTEGEKNGRLICRETFIEGKEEKCPCRSAWLPRDAWKFTSNKEKLLEMIPQYI